MMLGLTFLLLILSGCNSIDSTMAAISPTPGPALAAPLVVVIESPNPAYSLAQATIDVGQNQLLAVSRKTTQVSLDMAQAANSAAQSTQDYNQRQKMDLAYQATVISLNMAQAAATQKSIAQQTQIAIDATTAAQGSAATATQDAYLINVTQTAVAQAIVATQAAQTAQVLAGLTAYPLTATYSALQQNITETAQAQVILNGLATQTAQAVAALTAHPMTTTPFAVTKAALLMQEYGREQQSFTDQIVSPLIPAIAILDTILFVGVIILAYRRFMSIPLFSPLRFAGLGGLPRRRLIIDSIATDPKPANLPRPPAEKLARIEIVNATEPPVAHWIAEVEHQAAEGGIS
jgi:hypothetical protein